MPITPDNLITLNDAFAKLKQQHSNEQFTVFLRQLADIKHYPYNLKQVLHLLSKLATHKAMMMFTCICLANQRQPSSNDDVFRKVLLYIETIPNINLDASIISTIKLQELLANIFLQLNHADLETETWQQQLQEIIQQTLAVLNSYPHAQDHLLSLLHAVKPDDGQAYLASISEAVQALNQINKLLSSNDTTGFTDIFFSLMAHFSHSPNDLVKYANMLSGMDNDKAYFLLQVLANLLDQGDSLRRFEELIKKCETADTFDKVEKIYASPPYPPACLAAYWLEQYNFNQCVRDFKQRPYGERQLQFAFNLSKYKSQRSLFIGIADDFFTDAVGEKMQAELANNRQYTPEVLYKKLKKINLTQASSPEDKLKALCVCAEILARTAYQHHGDNGRRISQELNTTQLMTLYAMLVTDSTHIMNQIDTGQGKSRIMMMLAALKALQGCTVDFITSDMQLAERDYLSYKQFFSALGINTSLISLNTPAALYRKGGVNFSDTAQLQLARNRTDIDLQQYAYRDEDSSKRCLLIDEADYARHDKSSEAYNFASQTPEQAAYLWVYPLLVNFIKNKALTSKPDDFTSLIDEFVEYVMQHDADPEHLALLDEVKSKRKEQLSIWLNSAYAATQMRDLIHYVKTPADPDKLYAVRDHNGHTHYTRKILPLDHGRPMHGSTFADGVQQCLCVIENQACGSEEFKILSENTIQRSSYIRAFIDEYAYVYGVSGTTRADAPRAKPAINYEDYSYLTTPREQALKRDDKPIWAAKDAEQQMQFIKQALLDAMRSGKSFLLICRDDKQSLDMQTALQKDAELGATVQTWQRVHGLTEPDAELAAIKQAGQAGTVTISTTGMFSRGVDINAEHLVVVSAFVASLHEEIQVKGRSGRFGRNGTYRNIINLTEPEQSIKGLTYNIAAEVRKTQNAMAISTTQNEQLASLFALYLERVTQIFLHHYSEKNEAEKPPLLKDWQAFLSKLQKDWELKRDRLQALLVERNEGAFTNSFNAFIQKWIHQVPAVSEQLRLTMDTDIAKAYACTQASRDYYMAQTSPIKPQHAYDRADDGQAKIYCSLFAQSRAIFGKQRRLFANFRAWRENRGVLFADTKAFLKRDRDLFANTRATIKHYFAARKSNKR